MSRNRRKAGLIVMRGCFLLKKEGLYFTNGSTRISIPSVILPVDDADHVSHVTRYYTFHQGSVARDDILFASVSRVVLVDNYVQKDIEK